MKLSKLGVWAQTDAMSAPDAAAFARRVEGWGYGVLWIPEARGRDALCHAAWLLASTTKLVVATGIANIYARDAMAMKAGQKTLNEQSGGRFLLGLGVSHLPLVEGLRKHRYAKPLETMRGYLEEMKLALYQGPEPAEVPQTILAALGPKMLALSAEHADGAHPYNTTPEHTAQARKILGPGKLLCPEQALLLETDPEKARAAARKFLAFYNRLPNYLNNWKRLGFTEADCSNPVSDRLIDAMIGWGDEGALRARIEAHWSAGADHVCIQTLPPAGAATSTPDETLLALLAPARGGIA